MIKQIFHGISIDTPEDLIESRKICQKMIKFYQNLFLKNNLLNKR